MHPPRSGEAKKKGASALSALSEEKDLFLGGTRKRTIACRHYGTSYTRKLREKEVLSTLRWEGKEKTCKLIRKGRPFGVKGFVWWEKALASLP